MRQSSPVISLPDHIDIVRTQWDATPERLRPPRGENRLIGLSDLIVLPTVLPSSIDVPRLRRTSLAGALLASSTRSRNFKINTRALIVPV